jgi:hypothetical protein
VSHSKTPSNRILRMCLYGTPKEPFGFRNPTDSIGILTRHAAPRADAMHGAIGHINVYNIYGPCIMAMDEAARPASLRAPLDAARAARFGDGGPDGCIDASAAKLYLDNVRPRHATPSPPPAPKALRPRPAIPLSRGRGGGGGAPGRGRCARPATGKGRSSKGKAG